MKKKISIRYIYSDLKGSRDTILYIRKFTMTFSILIGLTNAWRNSVYPQEDIITCGVILSRDHRVIVRCGNLMCGKQKSARTWSVQFRIRDKYYFTVVVIRIPKLVVHFNWALIFSGMWFSPRCVNPRRQMECVFYSRPRQVRSLSRSAEQHRWHCRLVLVIQ